MLQLTQLLLMVVVLCCTLFAEAADPELTAPATDHRDASASLAPTVRQGKVLMQLFGPHGSFDRFPEIESPRLTWQQDALGLTRLPNHYDDWGVRDDWTQSDLGTMLVRGWTWLELKPGEYEFMIRSRGLSRFVIDGNEIVTTPAQRKRAGAHHKVDPLPEVPVPGMRPHFMNDHERIGRFRSAGGVHEVRFDVNVGSQEFCLRVGETCVAIASPGELFHILSPQDPTAFPLTDEGWWAFADRLNRQLDELDARNRRRAAASQVDYWRRRHDHARATLLATNSRSTFEAPTAPQTRSIDTLISRRIAEHAATSPPAAADTEEGRFYLDEVKPIFERQCLRCHADKQESGLNMTLRANLLSGGDSRQPAVIPGEPQASHLYQLATAGEDELRMPPEGPGLRDGEREAIRQWIEQGAVMPEPVQMEVALAPGLDDFAFLRRLFLDTVGVVPTLAEIDQFLHDPPESRRQQVIERVLRDPRWADNWVSYWQDVLAENPNLLKPTLNNTGPFRYWIHDALADNKPLDQFATELITMRGSRWYGGAAGFGVASQNDVPMAAKAHVIADAFLGVEMKCARCHDAPYHDWTQKDLFELAAMLTRKPITLPESSTVPAAFFQQQSRKSLIQATLPPRTVVEPRWPLSHLSDTIDTGLLHNPEDSREQLALYVTGSRRFAEVMANRLWQRFMGIGLVEPVNDWQGNVPSDPQLLAFLADELIRCGFDQRSFARLIVSSEAYQRQAVNADPQRLVTGPVRRRMTAEQIVDSTLVAVGQEMRTEILALDLEGTFKPDWFFNFGYPQRAWEFTTLANERDRPSLALPRAQAITDVLQAFGWRNSRPEPISQRESTPNLVQPGALANGTFGTWLTRLTDDSELTQMMLGIDSVETLVERLFLRMLTRPPTETERAEFAALLGPGFETRRVAPDQWPPATAPRRFRYVSWSNHLNTEANTIKTEMEAEARRGDPPTRYLTTAWRQRAEDAVWALLNNPEMILVP